MENALVIDKVNALTQEGRDDAMLNARLRITGAKPELNVDANAHAKYPRWLNAVIYALSAVMLIVAFLPSAIRLHAVGFTAFGATITHVTSIYVAALCVVLMAETGQVAFSLAAAVNDERWQRRMLYGGAFICTLIALTGNAVAVGHHATENAFAFLETFAPPILTLITSQVLKSQVLHAIGGRFEAKNAYEIAVREWNYHYENAHQHPDWMRVYANALREELRKMNKRSPAVMRSLTAEDWRMLILREVNAEQWYVAAEQRAQERIAIENAKFEVLNAPKIAENDVDGTQESVRVRSQNQRVHVVGKTSGTHTRELDNAVNENADGTYTGVCPHCARAFHKDEKRAAINALVAHARRCDARKSANALDDTQPADAIVMDAEVE